MIEYFKINPKCNWSQCKDWGLVWYIQMFWFWSLSCSSVLDELHLSNALLWKETVTIIHPAGDKRMNKSWLETKHLILAMFHPQQEYSPDIKKYGTTEICSSPTEKAGSVGGTLVLHWQTTSVLVVLTVSPILLFALTATARTVWRSSGVWATKAQSSAYYSSGTCSRQFFFGCL